MTRNVLTAKQVAKRLGVQVETVYAYVSRGVLDRVVAADGRTSRFDAADVERLARHGRPRRESSRVGSVDVSLATSITEIHDDRLLFRGHNAVALARDSTFEAVAELLWTGTLPDRVVWPPPPLGVRVARAAASPLPAATAPADRFAVVTAALACAHPLRTDLRLPAVTAHGRALITSFAELLPRLSAVKQIEGPGKNGQLALADRLWHGVSPLQATRERVALLNSALVLLADHELATSTLAARVAASTRADPFAVVMTGLGAVSGPLHGKAALAVHRMFERAADSSPELALAHAEDGAPVAAGFGHPVYRGSDPRAAYLLTALAPLMKPKDRRLMEDVTKAASRAGSAKPNVDFALGALAFALDMPFGATEAIFATARSAGWIAHALEEYGEAPLRFRSRAVYIGPGTA